MITWHCKWEELNPGFAARVLSGLATLAHIDFDCCIPESGGKRSLQEQQRLYAKRPKVTNCDGVKYKSMHQKGLAVDIVPADKNGNPLWPALSDKRWQTIREAMIAQGLRWGGDWDGDGRTRSEGDTDEEIGSIDYPHWESHGI